MSNFTAAQATLTLGNIIQEQAAQALFGELLPFIWKDVGIPYTDVKVTLRQDLAIHKFSDLDGADVEPTGRSPLEITAKVPFLNNIARAPSETWSSGDLYPNQFRKFFAACIDRVPGYLQHPEFGPIYCVVSHCEIDLKATTRDGVYVDVSWLETFEPNGSVSPSITGAGQISAASQAGVDLDSLLPQLPKSAFPQLPDQTTSFADFARGLQGVADQLSLLQYQTAGKIDSVVAQVQRTLNAFSQATGQQGDGSSPQSLTQQDLRNRVNAAISVQSWPTRDACDRYIASLSTIKQDLLASGRQVSLYIPAADTSLPMIATTLPASISDLMNLNPALLQKLVVPAYTSVRYYAGRVTSLTSQGVGS
jgi:prophage DNA circulation protein